MTMLRRVLGFAVLVPVLTSCDLDFDDEDGDGFLQWFFEEDASSPPQGSISLLSFGDGSSTEVILNVWDAAVSDLQAVSYTLVYDPSFVVFDEVRDISILDDDGTRTTLSYTYEDGIVGRLRVFHSRYGSGLTATGGLHTVYFRPLRVGQDRLRFVFFSMVTEEAIKEWL